MCKKGVPAFVGGCCIVSLLLVSASFGEKMHLVFVMKTREAE